MIHDADATIDELYRSDWGRIVATLIRHCGDFDLAEEAAQEAFAAALDQWRTSGVPDSPAPGSSRPARHKAIDRIRRAHRFEEKVKVRRLRPRRSRSPTTIRTKSPTTACG